MVQATGRRRENCFWAGLLGALLWFGHALELFVDLAGAVAGFGELGGVGEGLAEGFAGVGDLAAGAFGVGEGAGFAFFESVQAVFQAGDQADRVGVSQVGGGDADVGAGGAVEGQGDGGAAERAFRGRGEREAAEVAGPGGRTAQAVDAGQSLAEEFLEALRRRPRAWRKCARRRSW